LGKHLHLPVLTGGKIDADADRHLLSIGREPRSWLQKFSATFSIKDGCFGQLMVSIGHDLSYFFNHLPPAGVAINDHNIRPIAKLGSTGIGQGYRG